MPVGTEGEWQVVSTRRSGQYPEVGCIDIWICRCGAPDDVLQRYVKLLDEPEKTRAASYRVSSVWSAFVARRAMVRAVTSRYLGVPSDAFGWETRPLGRPFLRTEAGENSLKLSWSQTGTLVVVGVASGIDIGVDACHESNGGLLDGLADVFCSREESAVLACMPWPRRSRALVQCWAAKEACLKAAGTGFRCDPRCLRTWGSREPLESVEWNEGVDGSSGRHMVVAYRTEAGAISLAAAAPVPIALTMHRLVWQGGDDHELE